MHPTNSVRTQRASIDGCMCPTVREVPRQAGPVFESRIDCRAEPLTDSNRRPQLYHRSFRQLEDPIGTLTPREREILALMAEGRSNRGICQRLWLSPKTVETHIRGAFTKLGIGEAPEDNRRVLAVLAFLNQ
jgi:DNA-binding NarL/FixJ family response regulator